MPEIMRDESAGTAGKPLPSHARVVVIGGGVVGCSILFHLAKFGWKDVILLERQELTAGSSWHAAGMIHTLSSDPNISRLQGYTINLYKEIEETSGQSVGLNNTGGFYLASTRDWYDYLKRERSKARYMGLDQEFISPAEVARRHPLIDPKHYYAALWDELDGDLDPSGATYAFAKSARVHGAQYFTHTPVVETNQRADGSWDVVTPRGTVNAEQVVNCGGLWAREVGQLAGVALPVQPMEHHYLITEHDPRAIFGKRMGDGGAGRLPGGIDYEANIYFRQERHGVLLGTYEPKSTPWNVSGTPFDFGQELLPSDLDRIADRLEMSFERIPALGEAGIKDVICGPFTFGPDGNPMIGPVPGVRNYWVAVGVMAGFCQGGGVGRSIAEWMIDGEPSIDVWAMDIARFGEFATPAWGTVKSSENYERRFVMTFPNETLPKGRRQKTTALHDRLVARGAVMDQGFGLEHALWFADGPEDAHEDPSFRRSRAHDYVAREVRAVREAVGCIEIANYSKHGFTGPGARAFLDRVLAGRVPKPGRIALDAHADGEGQALRRSHRCLPRRGRLLRRRLGRDAGGAPALVRPTPRHRRRLPQPLRRPARHRALGSPTRGHLLARITRDDASAEAFRFRDIRRCYVGGVPAIVSRLSFSGELGYEIYVAPPYQIALAEAIEAAGADLGLRWYGARALMSLRLEKAWGVWTLDYRPDFTAAESGLDAFIQWDKEFVGKAAAEAERRAGPAKRLVPLVIEKPEIDGAPIDVSNDEAILREGAAVGYVSSGGYAHHVGQSMAMGYVPAEVAATDERFEIEILGEMFPARVHTAPLYDPHGGRMRS